jgi:DNA helicase-2/ATP-dependent DNA helicase PcrA
MPDFFPLAGAAPQSSPTSLPADPASPPRALSLDGLNATQRQAVETIDGPLLVLAGAGTGKTRVLTTRLAHILASGRARPWQVLAVTFTNKAAREMRERVMGLLGCSVEGWWVGTFHAVSARILRAHPERAGLKPNFTILDADDQLRVIKQLLEARNIDAKRAPPRLVLTVIQRWKDRGLNADEVPAAAAGEDAIEALARILYGDYQERLKALNAADFGDLLLHTLTLFRSDAAILQKYQRQFRYILVDEYQDTNSAQYLWLRALAESHGNICCVGDDDQSIYSWRGAEVGNILRFEADFPGARIVRLECNYRSTPHILAAASGLIAHNRSRLGKTLWTELETGERVLVQAAWDGEDEARMVCEHVESLIRSGERLATMAVLVRAGFQTREFEERMVTVGIPYRVVGGVRFYERQEIRDAIAYFRVVVQPDDDLAFERIANTPKRGLGSASLRRIHELATAEHLSLTAAASRLIATDELKPQARRALARLLDDLTRWRIQLDALRHTEVAELILEESGYVDMLRADGSAEAQGRLENLKELIGALGEFDTLVGFLEHVSLVMDNDEASGGDKITLMTLHGAKGLEFDTVFLPGWEEGLFPHQRALDEGGTAALEEERRLAYVGLTRARRRAIILHAASRHVYGLWQNSMASRFIGELPEANVIRTAPPGLSRSAQPWSGQRMGLDARPAADAASWEPRSRLTADRQASAGLPPSARAGSHVRYPPTLDGVEYRVDPSDRRSHTFSVGQRVLHQKFGYGVIIKVDGDKLEIAFEKAGTKTVVHNFVSPA